MHAPPPRPPDYGASPPAQVEQAPADVLRDDLKKVLREVSRIVTPAEPAADLKEELDRQDKRSNKLRAATDELNKKKDQPALYRRAERRR